MNYIFLFHGLEIDQEVKKTLDERFSQRVNNEVNWALNPFEYVEKYNGWFMQKNTKRDYFEYFPEGGYESKEQAELALSIAKTAFEKFSKKYECQELYKLSKFIWQGLQ